MEYQPKGVCSKQIHFDIVDNKVRNVSFLGGCNGNLQGISRLIEGMDVPHRRDQMRFQKNILPGSACTRIKRSSRRIIRLLLKKSTLTSESIRQYVTPLICGVLGTGSQIDIIIYLFIVSCGGRTGGCSQS